MNLWGLYLSVSLRCVEDISPLVNVILKRWRPRLLSTAVITDQKFPARLQPWLKHTHTHTHTHTLKEQFASKYTFFHHVLLWQYLICPVESRKRTIFALVSWKLFSTSALAYCTSLHLPIWIESSIIQYKYNGLFYTPYIMCYSYESW